MKLKENFISHDTGDEYILVPTGDASFTGVIRGNRTMGVMLELLREDTTEEKLVADLRERFDAPEGVVESDIKKLLAELHRVGALEGL